MTGENKAVHREPLVRIVKRGDIPAKKIWAIRALAALGAVLTGALLILALGHNPAAVYVQMVVGAVGSKTALVETIKKAIPLTGAAIAIAPAFKMKFWNIGAEGQIMAGAIAASYFALFHSQSMPRPLLLVIGMTVYLRRSKHGYEIAVVGESEPTARYAGMNVARIIVRTMLISGAIAGLVGFLQVSGANYTLTENTAGGIGFTAITVAWLAKLNPIAMVFIAAFLAVLQKGSGRIQTEFLIPASAAEVLTGIILFFMLGCEFFIHYRLVLRGGKEQKHG